MYLSLCLDPARETRYVSGKSRTPCGTTHLHPTTSLFLRSQTSSIKWTPVLYIQDIPGNETNFRTQHLLVPLSHLLFKSDHCDWSFAPEAMPSPGRMSELASCIQTHTAIIEEHFISQGQPLPSFGIDAVEAAPLPSQLSSSREIILDCIDELHGLALGPSACLQRLTAPHVRTLSGLYIACLP